MVTGIGSVQTTPQAASMMNGVTTTQMPPAEPVKRASDNRRSNKPIMEKRRRARINNCLNELKALILDAMKKDPARHSKLEKADILEMTVRHLENLQRQQTAMTQAADPSIVNKFKAGFTECANEVGRFPGLEPMVKRRLLQHLSNCINGVKTDQHAQQQQQQQQQQNQTSLVQVHILPSPPSSPEQDHAQHSHQQQQKPQQLSQQQQQQHQTPQVSQITATTNGYFLTSATGNAVQLIPTKLPNGNIALLFPQAPLPTLIPIPSRTSSTASAASHTSSQYERMTQRETNSSPSSCYAPPSPANSYEAMDCQGSTPHCATSATPPAHHHMNLHHHQQRPYSPAPLSLVIKKTYADDDDQQMKDDEKPWRPW